MGDEWFRYDGLGRVTEGTAVRADGVRGRQTYRYDGFGNLDQIWTAGVGYSQRHDLAHTNRITTANYDAAGNQISWGAGPLVYQYTYSPFNQIHLVSGGSPPVTRFYGYTADGERIASYASDTDVITHTLARPRGRVVREYEQISYTGAWSWKQDLVWGGNGLLATIDSQGTSDTTTSTTWGAPASSPAPHKSEEARHNYYPFGEEATAPYADPNRIKFTGHERDLEPRRPDHRRPGLHARPLLQPEPGALPERGPHRGPARTVPELQPICLHARQPGQPGGSPWPQRAGVPRRDHRDCPLSTHRRLVADLDGGTSAHHYRSTQGGAKSEAGRGSRASNW